MREMEEKAETVARFLKGLANPHRIIVLCNLMQGERSVSELIEITGISQTSMSQHLSKLKEEGIVGFRREHRTLHYKITNPDVLRVMSLLYEMYCQELIEPEDLTSKKRG